MLEVSAEYINDFKEKTGEGVGVGGKTLTHRNFSPVVLTRGFFFRPPLLVYLVWFEVRCGGLGLCSVTGHV